MPRMIARLTSSRSSPGPGDVVELAPKASAVNRIAEPEVQSLRAGDWSWPESAHDRRCREPYELLVERRELPVDRCVLVDDHIEHLVGADGGEGDNRITLLDREPREADPLSPEELVLLTTALVDLA